MNDPIPIPPDPAVPAVPVRPLTTWLEDFERHLALERNMSPHTVRSYRRWVGQALGFFAEQIGRPPVPADLTLPLLRDWAGWMQQFGYAYRSLCQARAALASFGEYLCAHDAQEVNQARRLTPLRNGGTRLPTVLTRAEVEQLMEAAGGEAKRSAEVCAAAAGATYPKAILQHWCAVRDVAMLEVEFSAALRVSELIGLNLPDIDLDAGEVRVRGKGGRERLGILGRPAVTALRHWLEERPRMTAPEVQRGPRPILDTNAVFIGKCGIRIGVREWSRRIREKGRLAGLGVSLHAHLLRHAAASQMLEAGASVRGVQDYLGHRSINSTGQYLHASGSHLRAAYDRAHPRAAALDAAGMSEEGGAS